MKRKPKTTPTTTIRNREELETRMGDHARVAIERMKLAAAMNKKLADVRELYEAMFAELDDEIERTAADLEAWAVLHPADFGERKSIELTHGTLGFRTGQPALKPLKGVRWDDVLTLLAQHPGYLRTIMQPDKEAILADRDALGAEGLGALGLRVEQAQRFYVEPRIEGEQ